MAAGFIHTIKSIRIKNILDSDLKKTKQNKTKQKAKQMKTKTKQKQQIFYAFCTIVLTLILKKYFLLWKSKFSEN